MAISELYAGTEAVGATEHSCTTDTAGPDVDTTVGVIQVFLDLADMVAGDELRVRVYEKVRSSSTQRIVWEAVLHAGVAVFVTPTLILMHGWDVTLETLAGTSITVEWSIRQVA